MTPVSPLHRSRLISGRSRWRHDDAVGTSNFPAKRKARGACVRPGPYLPSSPCPLPALAPSSFRMVLRPVVTLRDALCPCFGCWARL